MAKPKRKRKLNSRRLIRFIAIAIVFGMFASFLIGALASTPAQAATVTENCIPDVDGDGEANTIDADVDGDGQVNGVDEDIDGDGITNFEDQDPLTTNCTVDAPLPLAPKNDESDSGFIAALIIAILVTLPTAYFLGKFVSRRRK